MILTKHESTKGEHEFTHRYRVIQLQITEETILKVETVRRSNNPGQYDHIFWSCWVGVFDLQSGLHLGIYH